VGGALFNTAPPEVERWDWLLFVEQRVDADCTEDEITDELRARTDAEPLAEGAGSSVTERYELAVSIGVFVDGLLRALRRVPRGGSRRSDTGDALLHLHRS
jgi:hypothetical protein